MICQPCANSRHPQCVDAGRILEGRRTGCTCQHGQPVAHTATITADANRTDASLLLLSGVANAHRFEQTLDRLRADLTTPDPDIPRIVDSINRLLGTPTSQETQP